MTTITDNTALIIIDVQEGLDDPRYGQRNNPSAEANMGRLLESWRAKGRPVFHVKHMSTLPHSALRPELPGNAIKAIVAPQGDEPLFEKTVNSAFIGTGLEDRLREAGIDTVVIVGLTTNHCVSTSVRMAANLGFETVLVADATAAHEVTGHDGTHYSAEVIHDISLANLSGEFATVLNTDQVIGE